MSAEINQLKLNLKQNSHKILRQNYVFGIKKKQSYKLVIKHTQHQNDKIERQMIVKLLQINKASQFFHPFMDV